MHTIKEKMYACSAYLLAGWDQIMNCGHCELQVVIFKMAQIQVNDVTFL
jgi:hypothetical protein